MTPNLLKGASLMLIYSSFPAVDKALPTETSHRSCSSPTYVEMDGHTTHRADNGRALRRVTDGIQLIRPSDEETVDDM